MYKVNSFIRGYHAYCQDWKPYEGEVLYGESEPENQAHPENAVAIKKEGIVVGHFPDEACKAVPIFIRKGGHVKATVTGKPVNRRGT